MYGAIIRFIMFLQLGLYVFGHCTRAQWVLNLHVTEVQNKRNIFHEPFRICSHFHTQSQIFRGSKLTGQTNNLKYMDFSNTLTGKYLTLTLIFIHDYQKSAWI